MYLLQITLVGLTCCPVRNWANLRMSMRASANWWGSGSGASLLCELGTRSLSVRIFLWLYMYFYLHASTCTWQSNENYFKLHKSTSLITVLTDGIHQVSEMSGNWHHVSFNHQFHFSILIGWENLLNENILLLAFFQNWNSETKRLIENHLYLSKTLQLS